MADTTYVDGSTLLTADTMNDLNRLHYTIFSDPANAAAALTSICPNSAALKAAINDGIGNGALVFAISPTLVTPLLGTPTSGTLTNCTGLPVSTGISGLGTGVATALAVNVGSAGAPVTNGGALGTPSSGVATNLTGTANSLNAGIGVNQAYSDVTGSRAFTTQYTNSSGKPIFVCVTGAGSSTGDYLLGIVNGTSIISQGLSSGNFAGWSISISFIVPNGMTYQVNKGGNTTLGSWYELA